LTAAGNAALIESREPLDYDRNPYEAPISEAAPSFGAEHGGSGAVATRVARLLAVLADSLLYTGTSIPGMIVLFASFDFTGSRSFDRDPGSGLGVFDPPPGVDPDTYYLGLGLIFLFSLVLACYQWYLISTTGQSLGKRWLKIRIVRLDGSLPGFVYGVVLRVWVIGALGYIPYIGSCVGLIDALAIFGEEKRCIHDRIAGTMVVQA
jgi:uncharacterized RDD family membrane protein YckC